MRSKFSIWFVLEPNRMPATTMEILSPNPYLSDSDRSECRLRFVLCLDVGKKHVKNAMVKF